jgi:hypothetical protein
MNYKQKLNDTFIELLADLMKVSPDDGDFRLYHATCKTALILDDTFLYTVFERKVAQYEQHIMDKNEQFMKQLDIENQLETSTDDVKEYMVCVVKKLRSTWSSLSANDKEVVWRYWKTMLLLYKKISEST